MILNARSEKNLAGVKARLVEVVHRAADAHGLEFIVTEGLRTVARQRELVAKGASQTMQSRHLVGEAVDLAPVIDDVVRWDWPAFFPIATAMRDAAIALGVPITWGGCWDRRLNDLTNTQTAMENYVSRRRMNGQGAFVDGPHFQIELR